MYKIKRFSAGKNYEKLSTMTGKLINSINKKSINHILDNGLYDKGRRAIEKGAETLMKKSNKQIGRAMDAAMDHNPTRFVKRVSRAADNRIKRDIKVIDHMRNEFNKSISSKV